MEWDYDYEEKVLRIKDGEKILLQTMFSCFFHKENRLYNEENFKVIIPNSVETITFTCFSDMRASEYQIPDSVKEIRNNVFASNKFLKNIQWPSSVKSISSHVFYDCSSLENAILPEGLEVIGPNAFKCCVKLSKITIPNTVKRIGAYAFSCCDGLKSISVPVNVEKIERETFILCSSLEMVELHEGLLEIEKFAFTGCKSLTTITIPTTVESIGEKVFWGCKKLKEIYVPKALYDKYGKDYFKDDTHAKVIQYNEPMVKNDITDSKAGKETTENARITSSSKKEFKSFCGTIRTNFIADKRKK